jgi:Nucleotidyl transferase AbiEii toxin, Type IV TA system
MLHRETISDTLFSILEILSQAPAMSAFRLVGGTALAFQLGHRKSDDLVFFTEGAFDATGIKQTVNRLPGQATLIAEKPTGVSFVFDPQNGHVPFKIDIYNWGVRFIKPPIEEGFVRMASLEDIAAFKLEAACSRKEKKDYVDIAEILKEFSFEKMLNCYREKFPYADARVILSEIANTEGLELSVNPVMLNDLTQPWLYYRYILKYRHIQNSLLKIS